MVHGSSHVGVGSGVQVGGIARVGVGSTVGSGEGVAVGVVDVADGVALGGVVGVSVPRAMVVCVAHAATIVAT